jgi:hypothetical protein
MTMLTPATREEIVTLINTHARLQQLCVELRDDPRNIKVTVNQVECDITPDKLQSAVSEAAHHTMFDIEQRLLKLGVDLHPEPKEE